MRGVIAQNSIPLRRIFLRHPSYQLDMGRPYHPFIPDGYLAFEIGAAAIQVQAGIATRPQVAGPDSGGRNDIVNDGNIFRKAPGC